MYYDSESDIGDALSSRGSWYDVSTLIPSPLPTPPQFSEDKLSSGEDGYRYVDAEDHRKYHRWFAEDCMNELDGMGQRAYCDSAQCSDIFSAVEQITEEELDSIRMIIVCQFGHIYVSFHSHSTFGAKLSHFNYQREKNERYKIRLVEMV